MAPFIRTRCAPGFVRASVGHHRNHFLAGAAFAAMALSAAGCSDPALKTDLDTAGPPEVLAVTVQTETPNVFVPVLGDTVPETPVFCADGDKVNIIVCPDGSGSQMAAPDALPMNWAVRVTFSELLDADLAEELVDTDGDGVMDTGTIANTKPVTLQCGGTGVAYDGYYDPSGNLYTYPPGPSLVVIATDFIATGTSDCQLTLGDAKVKDKDGNAVDASLRGPYKFGIATMKIADNSPADMEEGVDPTTVPMVLFNAPVDVATVAGQVTVNDGTTDIAITPMANADGDPTAVDLVPDAGMLAENTTYTVTIPANATIADVAGGVLENGADFTFTFTTGTAN